MTTSADILSQLTSNMNVDQIRAIVNQWDMNVGNKTLLLYSGGVGPISNGRNQFGAEEIAKARYPCKHCKPN